MHWHSPALLELGEKPGPRDQEEHKLSFFPNCLTVQPAKCCNMAALVQTDPDFHQPLKRRKITNACSECYRRKQKVALVSNR